MDLNPQITSDPRVSREVAVLAFRRLELEQLLRGWPNPDAPQELALRSAQLRLDMAINAAVLATYSVSDEFELVAVLLTPREIGRFIWEASRARKPNYLYDQAG